MCGSVRAESMLLLLMLQAGKTPLHDAAWNGSLEVSQLLLDQGADIKATTKVQ